MNKIEGTCKDCEHYLPYSTYIDYQEPGSYYCDKIVEYTEHPSPDEYGPLYTKPPEDFYCLHWRSKE